MNRSVYLPGLITVEEGISFIFEGCFITFFDRLSKQRYNDLSLPAKNLFVLLQ